jgi:hypothetical protein
MKTLSSSAGETYEVGRVHPPSAACPSVGALGDYEGVLPKTLGQKCRLEFLSAPASYILWARLHTSRNSRIMASILMAEMA